MEEQVATQGLVKRYFTREGDDIFKAITWGTRRVTLKDANGVVLLDKEVEAPLPWSETAVTIAAYKYLRKRGVGTPEGAEASVKQLIFRVAHTIRMAGERLGHFVSKDEADIFEDELTYILVTQRAAFNSPVWFNVGLFHEYGITSDTPNWYWNPESKEIEITTNAYEHPQASACFIQSVKDNLTDIFDLVKKESQLFKHGSGSGTNFSTLRSRYEKLSGGGFSSGVMAFLKVLDAGAGATKSGGTTRRAAKMVILNVDHPEIMEFINWKAHEEEKAKILIEAGLPADFNGEAYQTVGGQNSNNSVRVTDEFMQAYLEGREWDLRAVTTNEVTKTLPARQIMREIAQAAWRCADPGMQYDTVVNKWHTCKVSGRINASNPCSEYMFLDDSACNLASINLVKYLTDDGAFDTAGFQRTAEIMITAQEILVDFSSYPSRVIAYNSHDYRPLGLGYANLGAYLMRLGLPYDSDEGRAFAAAVTAIMTGRAYAQSARLATRLGAFPMYAKNRESMLEVIAMHRAAAEQLAGQNPALAAAAKQDWEQAYNLGEKSGYRNSQTTVLAPTGTIGPLMDADTTGIEPDFALVKYKKLAGGGGYSIVNQSVGAALERLGYSAADSKAISDYILENGTVEGAPHIRDEHLAVFDCASKVGKGERFIRSLAHVEMVAAAQPFISGAISKTVNMPEETTVEEVEAMYIEAWKRGLKALALYRDNCKASQPLTVKKNPPAGGAEEEPAERKPSPEVNMPKTRQGVTHSFVVGNHKVYVTANHYNDGHLGEIFLQTAREGSAFSGLMDTLARLLSKALQRGESVESLVGSLLNMRFEPWGPTDDMEIPFAKSIPDYIARWIGRRYLPADRQVLMGIIGEDVAQSLEQVELSNVGAGAGEVAQEEPEPMPVQGALEITMAANGDVQESTAPPCPTCGAFMVRNGTCYACRECGTTTGCS